MELRDLLTMVRTHWVAIVVLAILGGLAAAAMSLTAEPSYRAQTTVLVSVRTGDSITDLNQGSSYAERQVQTYAEVARAPIVLEGVVDELDLPTTAGGLRSSVSASVQSTTALIDITVTRPSAEQAAAIANAVAEGLAAAVADLSPAQVTGGPSVVITPISPAVAPGKPFAPDVPQNVMLGIALGLVLGLSWATLRTTLDTKVRDETDLRRVTPAPLLGTVSMDPAAARKTPAVVAAPLSVRAEDYRQLRTNLQFVDAAHRPRSIVVTSSRGGEGKSVTTTNLALTLAESGVSVCLVDGDLRRPSVAAYLGLEGAVGLTTVLIGQAELDDVLQDGGHPRLAVLTSGQIPPNPSEMLASEAMQALLTELTERYDVVLVDSAPLLPVTDAAVLSKTTDGVLLVVGSGIATRDQVAASLSKLETIGSRLLGVVLNRTSRTLAGRRVYGYHPHAVELSHESSRMRSTGTETEDAKAAATVVAAGASGTSTLAEPGGTDRPTDAVADDGPDDAARPAKALEGAGADDDEDRGSDADEDSTADATAQPTAGGAPSTTPRLVPARNVRGTVRGVHVARPGEATEEDDDAVTDTSVTDTPVTDTADEADEAEEPRDATEDGTEDDDAVIRAGAMT